MQKNAGWALYWLDDMIKILQNRTLQPIWKHHSDWMISKRSLLREFVTPWLSGIDGATSVDLSRLAEMANVINETPGTAASTFFGPAQSLQWGKNADYTITLLHRTGMDLTGKLIHNFDKVDTYYCRPYWALLHKTLDDIGFTKLFGTEAALRTQ